MMSQQSQTARRRSLWGRTLRRVVLPLNILAIVGMILIGYTDHIDPRQHFLLPSLGLAMPMAMGVNVVFLIFWLLNRSKFAVVPIIGFLLCWGPVRRYCPVNIPSDPPKGAIKVLSFNVFMFNPWNTNQDETNPIVDYILNSGADIVCLQEASYDLQNPEKIYSTLASAYEYSDTVQKSSPQGDILAIYSRYPIISRERIKYDSRYNLSEAYVLNINGQKVLLVNNHLESVGLSQEDKTSFSRLVHGEMQQGSSKKESKFLLRKLGEGSEKRASQADAVADYIAKKRSEGMSVIVCGDFNDSPISYTHRRIARGLTDCYVATGNGPGWSYHKSSIHVRIDNILCSSEWKPYAAKVDNTCPYSDHYPIICWLTPRGKR